MLFRSQTLPAELTALLPARPRTTRRGELETANFPPEALDAAFVIYRAALAPLAAAGKLGYVLFQVAPWVRFSPARLEYLASLPARLPGWRLAVEFRDRSWFPDHAADTLAVLRAAGLTHVVVDGPAAAGAVPRVPVVTAPVAVLRLHGRNADGWLKQLRGEEPPVREKYDYLYREDELGALLPEVDRLSGEAAEVYIMFNNNNRAFPVQNALMMRRLLGQPVPAPPPDSLPRDLFA